MTEDARWGVYVRELNGMFLVEHRYMPTPNIEQPTTFDDIVINKVGEAKTREEAERIKQEYESRLASEAEKEEDDE